MHRGGQDDVANEGQCAGEHDVKAPLAGAVAVPGLEEDEEPADNVRRDGETLGIDSREAEIFDELCVRVSNEDQL